VHKCQTSSAPSHKIMKYPSCRPASLTKILSTFSWVWRCPRGLATASIGVCLRDFVCARHPGRVGTCSKACSHMIRFCLGAILQSIATHAPVHQSFLVKQPCRMLFTTHFKHCNVLTPARLFKSDVAVLGSRIAQPCLLARNYCMAFPLCHVVWHLTCTMLVFVFLHYSL